MSNLRRKVTWNRPLANRIQSGGATLLAIGGAGMVFFELWAAWSVSARMQTIVVLAGSLACLIGAGMCRLSGEANSAHIVVGVLGLLLNAGCAYVLLEVTGIEAVMCAAGVLMFGPGGAWVLSGQIEPYPFPE
ncbi:hypothetical protein DFQ14_11074 [Halopolyspora algeriensis]|uniref:Uncharacterized protein n=1 Tax=Halopolyspora algeriensis TaxID=1500506 RepID=A0A368VHL7_9ACTN|nr:hypothetical protein [Halopolyspora algeriensis]RCW40748.1 hypothetical protein DFQ14_11074 [Halopolyspora algeriensis]TQM53333.1 hypothetical protein FHU43_2724 [Halopolyspora algeriensis]